MCGGCESVKPEKILSPEFIEEAPENSHDFPEFSRRDREPVLLSFDETEVRDFFLFIRTPKTLETWKIPLNEKSWVPRYVFAAINKQSSKENTNA